MWDAIQFILLLAGYILIAYFITKFISKLTFTLNRYFKLIILSFLYAWLWGISIAATGGDPGFALPAPNIVAIDLCLVLVFIVVW